MLRYGKIKRLNWLLQKGVITDSNFQDIDFCLTPEMDFLKVNDQVRFNIIAAPEGLIAVDVKKNISRLPSRNPKTNRNKTS